MGSPCRSFTTYFLFYTFTFFNRNEPSLRMRDCLPSISGRTASRTCLINSVSWLLTKWDKKYINVNLQILDHFLRSHFIGTIKSVLVILVSHLPQDIFQYNCVSYLQSGQTSNSQNLDRMRNFYVTAKVTVLQCQY